MRNYLNCQRQACYTSVCWKERSEMEICRDVLLRFILCILEVSYVENKWCHCKHPCFSKAHFDFLLWSAVGGVFTLIASIQYKWRWYFTIWCLYCSFSCLRLLCWPSVGPNPLSLYGREHFRHTLPLVFHRRKSYKFGKTFKWYFIQHIFHIYFSVKYSFNV